MKGSKIVFFNFCCYAFLPDEYGMINFKGFRGLYYTIPSGEFADINNSNNLVDYLTSLVRYDIDMDKDSLTRLGVESCQNLPYLYIWDGLNINHPDHIHNMFSHMVNNNPVWIQ